MMAEQSKEPRRLVPRAPFTSVITIGLLYTSSPTPPRSASATT